MTDVNCNHTKCRFNEDMKCQQARIYLVDKSCVSGRNKRKGNDYAELMRPAYCPNSDRSGRKSNPVTEVLK